MIHKKLRQALITQDKEKRSNILLEIKNNYPISEERSRAICGIMDYNTSLDDIDKIESGEHISEYIKNNSKNIAESFLNPAAEEENYGGNEIPIKDSFNIFNDLKIEIDLDRFMERQNAGESSYGKIHDSKSNKKIMKLLEEFNNLSDIDKEDIKTSILYAFASIKRKQEKKKTKKTFVNAWNSQLDSKEKLDFLGILLAQINDVYSKNTQPFK